MAESEKDRMARQTAELRVVFDMALSNKRKFHREGVQGLCAKRPALHRDHGW